jgi:hypothetical protein
LVTAISNWLAGGGLSFERTGRHRHAADFDVTTSGQVIATIRQVRPTSVFAGIVLWWFFTHVHELRDVDGRLVLTLTRDRRKSRVVVADASGDALATISLQGYLLGHRSDAKDAAGHLLCSADQRTGILYHETPFTIEGSGGHQLATVTPVLGASRAVRRVERFDLDVVDRMDPATAGAVFAWIPSLRIVDPRRH